MRSGVTFQTELNLASFCTYFVLLSCTRFVSCIFIGLSHADVLCEPCKILVTLTLATGNSLNRRFSIKRSYTAPVVSRDCYCHFFLLLPFLLFFFLLFLFRLLLDGLKSPFLKIFCCCCCFVLGFFWSEVADFPTLYTLSHS